MDFAEIRIICRSMILRAFLHKPSVSSLLSPQWSTARRRLHKKPQGKEKLTNNLFKAEAVKKIADNNGNVSATAKQLGIAMQTLSNWQNKADKGKLIGTKEYDPELMAILEENKRLKRDLKVAQEERDILKKATAYFAKHS